MCEWLIRLLPGHSHNSCLLVARVFGRSAHRKTDLEANHLQACEVRRSLHKQENPCFHNGNSMSLEKLSTCCALLNTAPSRVALASDDCQKPGELGFQPTSKIEQMVAEIGPVALFQRRGSFVRVGTISFQTLHVLRLVS